MTRVFISYSHESESHTDLVRSLANQLRGRGFRITTDLDVQDPEQGWARWMEEQLQIADRVLMVFSETYRSRYEGKQPVGAGRGVAWEAHLIRNSLYQTVPQNSRIRVVIFVEDDKRHIPLLLRPYNYYQFPNQFDSLCRWLNDSLASARADNLTTPKPSAGQPTQSSFPTLDVAGPLEPSDSTYIRRKVDSELAELLDDQSVVCVSISGDYGIGKTSLLNRVPPMLGKDWHLIRPLIGDLRTDKAALCVSYTLEAFAPLAGKVPRFGALKSAFERRSAVLLLDDFGDFQEEGLNATLPMLIDLALNSNGRFRIVATLPQPIRAFLQKRGLADPKRHRPWKEVTVLPFEDREVRQLLQLLPKPLADQVLARMDKVRHYCQGHPKRLRIMLTQMRAAKPEHFERIIVASATNDQ
jgi:hypothetical protein